MSQDTWEFTRNAVVLVALLPILYGVGRGIGAVGDAWSAHILAPLAPVINGIVDRTGPCIRGTFQGRDLRVSFTPGQSVGSGDSATSINAFHIEVTSLSGRQNWQLQFRVTGTFGQGPKRLSIVVQDEALGERLNDSGVVAEAAAVSAPTTHYVTVSYEASRKTLTYTDDVSPRRVPSHDQFAAQLNLVARLTRINGQVNPA